IFLTDADDNVDYALRQYTELRPVEGKLVEHLCVDFYDSKQVVSYVQNISQDKHKESFVLDMEQPQNPRPHVFGITPIVKISNNDEEMGDIERVLSLIDAYDRTMSDVNSEIEQFRMAYMYFKGVKVTKEALDAARQTGGFDVGENGEI